MKAKIQNFVKTANIHWLVTAPVILSVVIFLGGYEITKSFGSDLGPESRRRIGMGLLAISSFLLGLSGFFQAYRKESPFYPPALRAFTVFDGVGRMLFCWGGLVIVLYLLFS